LISGTAGSGKTTMAASFVNAACQRGERCLFVGFEESVAQVGRNMQSVGMNLKQWEDQNLLFHEAWRPSQYGIELHLLRIHKLIERVQPQHVVIDPITNLVTGSQQKEVYSMLVRLMDYLKGRNITSVFTSLNVNNDQLEQTDIGISSLTDTWILCRDLELNGERNRCVYILKSRGMAHSNQIREFLMSPEGIRLVPPYIGSGLVLTGSSRIAQEAKEKADELLRLISIEQKREALERKRCALDAQIKTLNMEFAAEELELETSIKQQMLSERQLEQERDTMNRLRMGDSRSMDQTASAKAAVDSI
jgi:circadian clock protein KaiC